MINKIYLGLIFLVLFSPFSCISLVKVERMTPDQLDSMRQIIAESTRDLVLLEVKACLEARIREKGTRSFASMHELRGVVSEEYHELLDALHSKDLDQIESELMDLVVAGVFGLACIRNAAL